MFNDNPDLSPMEIMEKISRERHKSEKKMPTREERNEENSIKKYEKS